MATGRMCACRGRRHAAAGLGFKFPGRSESGRRSPPGSRRRVRLGARPALGGPRCQTRPGRLGHSPRRPESPLVTLRQVAPQLELGPLVPASGHRRAALFREPKTPNRSPRSKPAQWLTPRRSPSHRRLLYDWARLPSRSAQIIVIASPLASHPGLRAVRHAPCCVAIHSCIGPAPQLRLGISADQPGRVPFWVDLILKSACPKKSQLRHGLVSRLCIPMPRCRRSAEHSRLP